MSGKRLKIEDWQKIKILLEKRTPLNKIMEEFNISRNSIYVYARRRGWDFYKERIIQKEAKKGFWGRVGNLFIRRDKMFAKPKTLAVKSV